MKYEVKRIVNQTTLNGIAYERYDDGSVGVFNPDTGKSVEIPSKYTRSAIRFLLRGLRNK